MTLILKGGNVYINGTLCPLDILVEDSIIKEIAENIDDNGAEIIDVRGLAVFPGFSDVHVHLREPGFLSKETIKSGTLAAARGGYANVCSMPNLNPCPDTLEHLRLQLDAIEKDALVNVIPYGTITMGEKGEELSEMDAMAPYIAAFSDDGRGVQSDDMMRAAMKKAKALGKLIAAHCEDNSLLRGGYIHDGEYAAAHGHRGICSESEWAQVARDIELVRETGVSYHVCHISTKETVELIRNAKKEGLSVTCETGPHYLTMTDADLQEDGRFKMNPPIRSEEDRQALLAGLLDGTIDMIATDHAPHTAEEKGRGLEKSLMGVVGLETAFPVLYTDLVKTGIAPLSVIINAMSTAPAKRFGLEGGEIKVGEKANFCVFDLEKEYIINSAEFLSMGKATPFEGKKVFGRSKMNIIGGIKVWQEK
ncbi:MAG: dihydroorotase [Clostridia bacterium]|nr:dihydroorotase [Clostridia bacterium]